MNTPPPAGGMVKQFSGHAPLPLSVGKLHMICPVCSTDFLRPAAWAKRVNSSYCSRACAWAAKVTRYEHHCVVCDASMLLQPSEGKRKLTCSPLCSSIRKRSRSATGEPTHAWKAYQEAAEVVRETRVCCRCGVKHGPWVVRALRVTVEEGRLPEADASAAFLVCQSCHFKEVGSVGAKSGHERRRKVNAMQQEDSADPTKTCLSKG